MAIYDTMQSLQSPVGTHCVGYAYNLAGFLLAAGEKVIYVPQKECIKCNDSRVLICINNFCDGFWSIICVFLYEFVKGHRFTMPLSRIALESPAGAARGQVWTYVKKGLQFIDIVMPNIIITSSCLSFSYQMMLYRLMIFKMKQMNFWELEIIFSRSWLKRLVNLWRRYSIEFFH